MSAHTSGDPRASGSWLTLAAFCALVALTQVLWLSFAPVTDDAARLWDVGAGTVGDLTVLNPLAFVLLAWPAGRWVDQALPRALAVGALLSAGGAVLRALDPTSLPVVGAGQLLLSVGQPLVLGATTAVAVRALPPHRRSVGIAAASAAQLLGILLAALTVPWLVGAHGIAAMLQVQAVVAVVVAVTLVASLRRLPGAVVGAAAPATLRRMTRDPLLLALATCLFVGVGLFNVLATWLEPMLAAARVELSAGAVLAMVTGAGIVGAAVLAPWATRRGLRRPLMVAAGLASCLGLALVGLAPAPVVVAVTLTAVGLVLLSGLPVALEWAEEHVGPAAAGRTTSLLLWSGNLGGVLLTVAVQPLVPHGTVAFAGMALLAVPAVVAAALLPAGDVTDPGLDPAVDPAVDPGLEVR